MKSSKSNTKVTKPRFLPSTPTIKQVPRNNINPDQIVDLKKQRALRAQVSLNSEYRKGSLITIQNEVDIDKYFQIQTTRTQRTTQIDLVKIQEPQINNTKRFSKSESNEKILDLLLLDTQQLKDIFAKQQQLNRTKPKINNPKGFPSDFFSIY